MFCSIFLYPHIICFSGDCWWQIVYFSLKYIYPPLLKKNFAEYKYRLPLLSLGTFKLSYHCFLDVTISVKRSVANILLFPHFYYFFHFVIPFLSFFKIFLKFFSWGYDMYRYGVSCLFFFILFRVCRLSSVCRLMSFINLEKFLTLSSMSSNIILLHSLSFLPDTAIMCAFYLLIVSQILLTLFSLFSILPPYPMFQTKKLFISSVTLSVSPSI